MEAYWEGKSTYKHEIVFYVTLGNKSPWPSVIPQGLPEHSPNIKKCAKFIKSALRTCEDNHSMCKPNQTIPTPNWPSTENEPKFMPKRLLYIGSKQPQDPIRLYEPEIYSVPPKRLDIQYAALSHCWGGLDIARTTQATLSKSLATGILWSKLSTTFQDAISFARELNIKYIWIDSLCIVQDSMADWAHQASQMANIFASAYLTIAASGAENGNQGLWNRVKMAKFTKPYGNSDYTVCVRERFDHELHFEHEHEARNRQLSTRGSELTLRKRAWCLQEELLSKRVVHFTRQEIVFVCLEATICECIPFWENRFKLILHFGNDSIYKTESWCELVRIYSGRNITFWQDRLPALSSLTNYFEKDAGQYLAGLWEAQLPACILWFTIHGRRAKPPNPSICSPLSWSWASIEGGIIDFEEQNPPDLEGWDKKGFWWIRSVTDIIEGVVYPSTSDPRGMVSGGYMTLVAPMLPLRSIARYCVNSDGSDWRHEPHLIFQPGWAPHTVRNNQLSGS
ncbi:HET domain containing protein [Pyrenophora tritici-repentis]|nr:HET domain containing protein [Pyrenophora tritici-repentis]KAI1562669.1 HET domain containing protein [Pyrenophora tritici-repentis]